MNIKKCNKKWGHRARLTVNRVLKWVIFTGCALKIRITFIKNWVLVTWKMQSFILKAKLHFVDISSIASFKLFLIAWLREYCTFRTVLWLTWSPRLRQNTPSWELLSEKKSWSTIKLFFFFKYVLYNKFFIRLINNKFFIRLFLANTWKKNSGVTVLVQEKRRIYLAIELSLGEISYVLYVHARMCAR